MVPVLGAAETRGTGSLFRTNGPLNANCLTYGCNFAIADFGAKSRRPAFRTARGLSSDIMTKRSAGLLLFRRNDSALELLLVHMGGPFWAKKDDGAWSILEGDSMRTRRTRFAARREFEENRLPAAGRRVRAGPLQAVRRQGDRGLRGRRRFRSAEFPEQHVRDGMAAAVRQARGIPEADRAAWFAPAEALRKVTKGRVPDRRGAAAESSCGSLSSSLRTKQEHSVQ